MKPEDRIKTFSIQLVKIATFILHQISGNQMDKVQMCASAIRKSLYGL